jgi:hypothetical protein
MPDLNSLSNEELMAIAGIGGGGDIPLSQGSVSFEIPPEDGHSTLNVPRQVSQVNYNSLSNEELMQIAGVQQPLSMQQNTAGMLGSIGQGVTLGLADEAAAGVRSGISSAQQLLGYEPSYQDYNSELEALRGGQKQFDKTHPVASVVGNIAGGVALPVGGLTSRAKGILQTLGALGVEGAAIGGAYGFGAGEGSEDRLSRAKRGAAVGGIANVTLGGAAQLASKALSGIAKKAPDMSENLLNSSMGATSSDFTRAAKYNPSKVGNLADDIETTMKKSLRGAREEGVLAGGTDPQEIYKRAYLADQKISNDVTKLVKEADKKLAGVKVLPQFTSAQKYVDDASVKEQPALQSALNDWIDVVQKKGGSVEFLHHEKKKIYELAYPEGGGSMKGLDRAVANDLKRTIENTADRVLPTEKAGMIKSLNKRLGTLEETMPIFARNYAKDESATIDKGIMGAIRTSGGVATPVIVGTAAGGPSGGAIGGVISGTIKAANSQEGKRKIGDALATIGPKLQKSADLVSATGQRVPIVAGNLSSRKKSANTTKENKSLSKQQDRVGIRVISSSPNSTKTAPRGQETSEFRKIAEKLAPAIAAGERSGDGAISPKGAMGKMQLMPEIVEAFDVKDPFDPEQSLEGGIKLLTEELQRYRSIPLAVMAYNAGSPAVNRAIKKAGSREPEKVIKHLPLETRKYLPAVMKALEAIS